VSDRVTRTTVTIYGEEYTLKGDLPEEVVVALAHHVDSRMRILATKGPQRINTTRLAILAALNLAEELFALQNSHQELTVAMQERWRSRRPEVDASSK
jgi:cell division protein ZapA